MNIWIAIFIATIISVFIRVLPAFLASKPFIKHAGVLNFLDYASCAAIGGMIYISVFPSANVSTIVSMGLPTLIANISILIIAFTLSLLIRNPVKTFIICMLLYMTMILLINL